jgi:phytoene dehydrogenase-like protein
MSARLRRRVERLRYSVSTISLSPSTWTSKCRRHRLGNIWCSRTRISTRPRFAERADLTDIREIPGLFFNVTTLKDPSMRTDGLHTVEALAVAACDALAKWRGTKPGERGPEYARLKEYLSGKILDEIALRAGLLTRRLQRARHAAHQHPFHPRDAWGIYAPNLIRNLGPFAFPVKTEIGGLFECGASIAPCIHGDRPACRGGGAGLGRKRVSSAARR